ncbi:AAA family ATPase [Candidatus Kapabacteria bacterium]|nr:AAA family ATPase [Candidatus Kapabacteria bacterium]
MEIIEANKNRIKEIDSEIKELRKREVELEEKWKSEKKIINKTQYIKAEIEQLKVQAEKYEREGNLEKVAEIRYGTLHVLQNELEKSNSELQILQENSKLLNEIVKDEDIAEIVAKWTGVPINKMLESERSKLVKMEDRLNQSVIGQQEAVSGVSNAIRRTRAGLQDENRPIGSFIFIGTTGVGKTEMAKALAEFLFDDKSAMVRIDMSEYSEKFAVSRLIGAPPGYVGYDEGGQLTEPIRKRPYAVILLDEIEKAHPEVFNILLQLLDDGRLTDSKGRTVNFSNTIVIMTSNLGTNIIQNKINDINAQNKNEIMSSIRIQILQMLRRTLRPEFLNRIDEVVLFNPLTAQEIYKIAELQLRDLKERSKKQNINLEFDKSAIEWLAQIGFDLQFGARPLKRAIQRHITDKLSINILEQKIIPGDTINVKADDSGKFEFNKQ